MAKNFPRGSAIYVFLVYKVNFTPKKRIQDSLEIEDSTPWTPDSRYWIPDSLSVDLGFWILIFSRIRDSLRCISVSKPRIPDSKSKNFPDSGIRIPLLGQNNF